MRKKHLTLGGLAVFVAIAALPIINIYAASRTQPGAFTELRIGKQEVYVIGEHATYLAQKLQEYSDSHGSELIVFGPNDENEANTVIVSLISLDRMNYLPEHWQRCGDTCDEEAPGELYAASVSEAGLLGRNKRLLNQ